MRVLGAILAAGLVACAWGTMPHAPRKWTVNESHAGYGAYRQYCAACHGVFADGLGPVAPLMQPRPTDLTRLGQRYGQPLPMPKLSAFIDGRIPVQAHGPTDMPVWGERLFEGVPPSAALEPGRRGMVLLILDYLDSVQRSD